MRVMALRWTGTFTLLGLAAQGLTASRAAESPWPADVPGWVAPKPGEHPRLLFRQGDLPEMKKRAETPEGDKVVVGGQTVSFDGKRIVFAK